MRTLVAAVLFACAFVSPSFASDDHRYAVMMSMQTIVHKPRIIERARPKPVPVIKEIAETVEDTAKAVHKTARSLTGYADHVVNEAVEAMDCAGRKITEGGGMTTVRTPSGKCFTVAKRYAKRFAGFASEFERAGYKIAFVYGYSRRKIAGTNIWSKHASGAAIDICQLGRNRVACKMPPNVTAMAARHGLLHGAVWRNADAGHFEIATRTAGTPKPHRMARARHVKIARASMR